ncbi:hypothetical protein BYT27DRAFT_7191235 [Phlegmacium glaucopus]|nr:hypothetical protein BYT27DRAFT_7191235 [Phlegmacium glaucopus]
MQMRRMGLICPLQFGLPFKLAFQRLTTDGRLEWKYGGESRKRPSNSPPAIDHGKSSKTSPRVDVLGTRGRGRPSNQPRWEKLPNIF